MTMSGLSDGRKMLSSMKRSSSEKNLTKTGTLPYQRPKSGRSKNAWDEAVTKPSPRKPTYKSPEEYYDEIMQLKKKIQDLNQEKSTMKSKLRRLEEENRQKDKQLEGLLNPNKSDELRRTLTDKRADSGAVVHSLKQKILKLETQLKDKEAAHTKLQNDLKTTKVEEMRVQMETFCQEIARLQNLKSTEKISSPTPLSSRLPPTPDNDKKVKPLHETIIRLSKQNEALQSENIYLESCLQSVIEQEKRRANNDNSEELQKYKNIILQLKDDLNYYKSLCEKNSQTSKSPPKIATRKNKVLKSEKENIQEMPKYIQTEVEIHNDIEHVEKTDQLKKNKSPKKIQKGKKKQTVERTAEDEKKISDFRQNRAAKKIQHEWKSHQDREAARETEKKVSNFRQDRAAKKIQREWKSHKDREDARELEQKVTNFQHNRAARKIQHEWKSHQVYEADKRDMKVRHEKAHKLRENRAAKKIQNEWTGYQYRKHEKEVEEATELIQSTLKGHSSRKKRLFTTNLNDYPVDDYTDPTDAEYDSTVELIQSSVNAHSNRKKNINKMKKEMADHTEIQSASTSSKPSKSSEKPSRFGRFNPFKKKNPPAPAKSTDNATYDDDDDDDIVLG